MFNNMLMGAAGESTKATSFSVGNSALFNDDDSEFLGRTPSSDSNRKKGIISCWVKRANLSDGAVWGSFRTSGGNNFLGLSFSSDAIVVQAQNASSTVLALTTSAVFRDPHAWYHIVFVYDTTPSTPGASNIKIYVNGEVATLSGSPTYPSQNTEFEWGNNVNGDNNFNFTIGDRGDDNFFDGYVAEFVYQDGQSFSAITDYGETDINGVWRPVSASGLTFGTNGYYLKMASSGADLGDDASGNSNDFTNNNSATQSGDSPTSNYCTFTPFAADNAFTFSDGNLEADHSGSGDKNAFGTQLMSNGAWYWEFTIDAQSSSGRNRFGIFDPTAYDGDQSVYNGGAGAWFYGTDAAKFQGNSTNPSFGVTSTTGDVLQFAYNTDGGNIWVGKNGTWMNSATQSEIEANTTTNAMFTGITADVVIGYAKSSGASSAEGATLNAGATAFAHTAPSGYKKLNASNLFAANSPTIEDGTAYFQATTYTGNGADAHEINQSGNSTFKPSWAWFKNRSIGDSHALYDLVRGITKRAYSNSNADGGTTTHIDSFDADGFTVNNDTQVNGSGNSHVTWQWKGDGTSGSTNSDGSINSTVNVETTSGLSIGVYTTPSEAAAVRTIGHGLGGALDMLFLRNQGAGHWAVWHNGLSNEYLRLNSTDAATTGGTETNSLWNATLPSASSTTFSIGTNSDVNGNNVSFMFYAFRAIEGYSAFGSYVGNANSSGPVINVGFKPAYVIIKQKSTTGDWISKTTAVDPLNPLNPRLYLNSADAASSSDYLIDILSNGFKVRDNQSAINGSGNTLVYAAWAEHPFAGTTPATAH